MCTVCHSGNSPLPPSSHQMTAVQAPEAVTSRVGDVQAEHDEELFDTYDPEGNHTGVAPRAFVHANGIWHGAVYCLVYNQEKKLLIQRRSQAKKVMPGRWDLSAAEHLSAGETYCQAVVRGLEEEVGIALAPDVPVLPCSTQDDGHTALRGPLAPRHQRKLEVPEIGVHDYEFVETWELLGYQGSVAFNQNEVQAVQWVGMQELAQRMREEPNTFTPWFIDEAKLLGLLPSDA